MISTKLLDEIGLLPEDEEWLDYLDTIHFDSENEFTKSLMASSQPILSIADVSEPLTDLARFVISNN